MNAYPESYLNEVVETQGKLFDYVANNFPTKDTTDFIQNYMQSKTRKYIDECQPYVNTMDYTDLFHYFLKEDKYSLKDGANLQGFLPDWIGEFYAYYQWKYNVPSSTLINKITIQDLQKSYPGLHDLELELAVQKAGNLL